MVTFRSNNNRRPPFRSNNNRRPSFRSNNEGSKFSNNDNFQRRVPGRNNHNASKLIEKYNDLAREALANEDKILSENYLQHADHFMRVQSEKEKNQPVKNFNNTSKETSDNTSKETSDNQSKETIKKSEIIDNTKDKKETEKKIVNS
jgi:hypothetical protein